MGKGNLQNMSAWNVIPTFPNINSFWINHSVLMFVSVCDIFLVWTLILFKGASSMEEHFPYKNEVGVYVGILIYTKRGDELV